MATPQEIIRNAKDALGSLFQVKKEGIYLEEISQTEEGWTVHLSYFVHEEDYTPEEECIGAKPEKHSKQVFLTTDGKFIKIINFIPQKQEI